MTESKILEAFFRHTQTCLVFLDKDFNFIRVNEAYAKACQRDVSEFPGRNHFELYPSDARAEFERVVRTKERVEVVARPFTFPDHPAWGVTYWDWTLVPILDGRGDVELLVFSLNDVTERKRAEEALRAAEQWLRTVVASAPIIIFAVDAHGVFTLLEGKSLPRIGLSPGELVGVSALERYGALRIVEDTGAVTTIASVVRRVLDGETVVGNSELQGAHFDTRFVPLLDAQAHVVAVVGVSIDTTERTLAEVALSDSEAHLRLITNNALALMQSLLVGGAAHPHQDAASVELALALKAAVAGQAYLSPVRVYSEVGQGTSFTIYLPQVNEAAHTERPAPVVTSRACTETILVVEDNAGLRTLSTRILEPAGYTVLLAASGEEALGVLAGHDAPVDLLLSDVVMPGMSGRHLAEQLAPTHPDMKVLYMSGYTSDTIVRHGVLEAQMAFLNKPFTGAALLRKVRETLDTSA